MLVVSLAALQRERPLNFFNFELMGSIFERPPNPKFFNGRSSYIIELIFVKKQPEICQEILTYFLSHRKISFRVLLGLRNIAALLGKMLNVTL
jgi:hypothetical protein